MRGDGTGFTLIEVLVALTLAAVVLLLAHAVFSGVVDGSRRLVVAQENLDRETNARRWLAAAFLSLEVGQDSAGPFDGESSQLSFSTWLETEHGWLERRRVVLRARTGRLTATLTPGDPIVLADSVTDLGLDYLLEPGAETRWVREWISPVSAPLAVRLRIARGGPPPTAVDTILLLVKARG